MSNQITLHTSSEFTQLDSSKGHDILSLLTVKAPTVQQQTNSRAPLDIVAVLDVSGSMGGDKINMMRNTMCFAIKQLQSSDRLAIVLFESRVSVLFRLTQMTGDAKHQATELVERINTRGSTALAGGLEKGYDILIEDSKQNKADESNKTKKVTSILLFTDGEANIGLQSSADIVAMMKSKQASLDKACTVFSFGYGKDHSAELLQAIAEAGSGMYYFVEDEEKIASAFGDCIGGLLSVSAQNIELKMEAHEGVTIKKIFGSTQKVGGIEVNSNKYSMELGDIYHEEERNILILLHVSALTSSSSLPFTQKVMECELKGFDVLQADKFEVKQSLSMVRDTETKRDTEKSDKIEIQRNRLLTVEAVDGARKLANEGKIEQAREVLNKCIQSLKNSGQSASPITQQLIADLQESLTDMRNQEEFQAVGSKKMAMCSRSHQVERAIHSKEMYSNSSKSATKSAFKQ